MQNDPTLAAGVLIPPYSPNVEIGGSTAIVTVSRGRVTLAQGGMVIRGSAEDVATFHALIAREILTSKTFNTEVLAMIKDTAHPVTFDVGRDNALLVDAFATNAIDLNDIAWFERDVNPDYPWVQTQGEALLHVIVERRDRAINGSALDAAHKVALAAGGAQEQYRNDRGQPGYIVSQDAMLDPTNRHRLTGVFTDSSGNVMYMRIDQWTSQPVLYEVEYQPSGGGIAVSRKAAVGLLAVPMGNDGFDSLRRTG